MARVVVVVLALAACRGAPRSPAPIANGAPAEGRVESAPAATFTAVRSPEAFCTALAHRPRKPEAYADVKPVEAAYGDYEALDEPGEPPGCRDAPAWIIPGDLGAEAPIATHQGPFAETRIVSIVDERGGDGCALFVQHGATWFVSLDAVADCAGARTYEEVTGSFHALDRHLVIDATTGHDPCGCDDDLWVSSQHITVCGVSARGVPACAGPLQVGASGAERRQRPWFVRGTSIVLGAWVYVVDGEPGDAIVPADEGGEPPVTYRLSF